MDTLVKQKLKSLEKSFLNIYPLGFQDPEMIKIGKKHKMDPMIEFVQDSFAIEKFTHNRDIVDNFAKVISRSSMVSTFEKMKFRDFIKGIGGDEIDGLVYGLKERLHGNEQEGFEVLVDILSTEKLAKWPILTAIPLYYRPTEEVFVKPTTVKAIIAFFELESNYKPAATWEFYKGYRKEFNALKQGVSETLYPNNAAFSGFFMMTLMDR